MQKAFEVQKKRENAKALRLLRREVTYFLNHAINCKQCSEVLNKRRLEWDSINQREPLFSVSEAAEVLKRIGEKK